jgi:hypothetical protein
MDAAVRAKRMLSYASLKAVDCERVLATQEIERVRDNREVENSLFRADAAAAL